MFIRERDIILKLLIRPLLLSPTRCFQMPEVYNLRFSIKFLAKHISKLNFDMAWVKSS